MSGGTTSWGRRRAAVAAEAAAEEAAIQEAVVQAEQAELAERPDAEILEELGLPDPDSMIMGDDFKAFMAKAVPNHIRKKALRTLWRSNPVLACVDGLNDYDDDYLTGSKGQVVKTSYQVGKGMLSHLIELERQKNLLGLRDEADEADEAAEIDPEEDVAIAAEPVTVAKAEEPAPEPTIHEDTPPDPTPRRMQFQFEDHSV